jgi:hypothetical protein
LSRHFQMNILTTFRKTKKEKCDSYKQRS